MKWSRGRLFHQESEGRKELKNPVVFSRNEQEEGGVTCVKESEETTEQGSETGDL